MKKYVETFSLKVEKQKKRNNGTKMILWLQTPRDNIFRHLNTTMLEYVQITEYLIKKLQLCIWSSRFSGYSIQTVVILLLNDFQYNGEKQDWDFQKRSSDYGVPKMNISLFLTILKITVKFRRTKSLMAWKHLS